MAIITIPNTRLLELTIKGHAAGQQFINILHLGNKPRMDGAVGNLPVDVNLTFMMNAFMGGPTYGMLQLALSDQYYLDSLSLKHLAGLQGGGGGGAYTKVYGGGEDMVFPFEDVANQGAVGGDHIPTFNCFSWRKKTTVPTRVGRGSMRVGPIAETHVAGQALTASGLNLSQTAANAILKCQLPQSAGAAVWVPVVFSPQIMKKVWAVTPPVLGTPTVVDYETHAVYGGIDTKLFNPITVAIANSLIGRQISRQARNAAG